MTKEIVQNSVICNLCKEEIWSAHVHDFKTCSCGNISVDGGLQYLRRVGKSISDSTDTSLSLEKEVIKDMIAAVKWANETGRNEFGVALAVIRAIRKHGLLLDKEAGE